MQGKIQQKKTEQNMSEMYICKELCCCSQNLQEWSLQKRERGVGLGGTGWFGSCALHVLQTTSDLMGSR